MPQRFGVGTALVGLALVVAACTGAERAQLVYSPAELRATAARQLRLNPVAAGTPQVDDTGIEVPYQVSDRLLERAREMVKGLQSEHAIAHRLLRGITRERDFGLRYEPVSTTTAVDTVERGYGNCLSLTSLYVGLARGLGLTAYYIDASDRINDLRREEQLIVDSGHVAAVVRTERGYSMVDFDGHLQDFRTFRVIDDVEALAHFYNNSGYELLYAKANAGEAAPWEEAAERFERAVRIRPGFARARNNLGVAYSHLGVTEEAAAQYRAAHQADDKFAAPLHNLGNLYLRAGDVEAALDAYAEAVRLQGHNPYLHFHRGVAFYRVGDLEAAAGSFRRAIALKHDYVEPRNVLAQVYVQLGRPEEARKVLEALRDDPESS